MTVDYITYDPPLRVAMSMIDGPRFFDTFAGTWLFKPLETTLSLLPY